MVLKYGLLGQGISYSLSPKIHLFSADILGIEIEYEIIDLNPTQVQTFLSGGGADVPSMHDYHGFNVTVPYKEAVAKSLGAEYEAVNCAIRKEGGTWIATNTDGEGFLRSLIHTNENWQSIQNVHVLGFGGAVKGILGAVLLRFTQADFAFKPKRVCLFRRTVREQEEARWTKKFATYGVDLRFHNFSIKTWESMLSTTHESNLIIQGTDAPRRGDMLKGYAEGLHVLAQNEPERSLVVDLMYGTVSDLLNSSRAIEIPSTDGLPMLIEQARLAQQLWWGKSASFQKIKEALDSLHS